MASIGAARRLIAVGLFALLAGCGSEREPASSSMPASSAKPDAPEQAAPAVRDASEVEGQLAMDECGLHTKWSGDEYCILPPPADKGFQIHVGPSDYDNPDPRYVLEPGQETTETFPAVSGNDREVYYYYRQYRMRPGSHHLIVMSSAPELRRLGGSQNLAKDNPNLGIIPEENKGVGMKLAPKTQLGMNLHYMNYTQQPIIKEVWVNFWYRDAADVTEPASEVFSGAPMNVAPGKHVLIHSECEISQPGRLLQVYGHRHANNQRFSVWRKRGQMQDLLYEDYDWEHPLVLEFSSALRNVSADPETKRAGGWSGVLDLQPGDKLAFECDVLNATDHTFIGKNEALDDEMCIMVGDSVGARVPPRCTSSVTDL